MLTTKQSKQFKQEYERMKKRGKDMNKIKSIIKMLVEGISLPKNCKDHPLKGNYAGYRETHIEPDWLLIYTIKENNLYLYRTGSHSDLFG